MFSHVGIIIGAVVSALLGLYALIPDGGLRTFDYWLSIWQPIVWDAPAAVYPPLFEQEEEDQFPLHPSFSEEEVMDENHFEFIGHEDIKERLQSLSDLLSPEIGPRIPPRAPHPRMLRFHQAVVEILSILWPHFIICLLPRLLVIVLAQKTCAFRKLQKPYEAEKWKNAEVLAGQKSKECLEKIKARDEDEEEKPITSEQKRSETLDYVKFNDDQVKKVVAEGPSELPDAKSLPTKHRRPGKRNSKRDHKFEAEKRKRKQAEKKAALADVAEEGPEEAHEKK